MALIRANSGSGGGSTPTLITDSFNTTTPYTVNIRNGVFSWLYSSAVKSEYVFVDGVMTKVAYAGNDVVSYDGTTFSISNDGFGVKPIYIYKVD